LQLPDRWQRIYKRRRTASDEIWIVTRLSSGSRGCTARRYNPRSTFHLAQRQHRLVYTILCSFEINGFPGYDLKQLFIGAEGTLGVVTGVSLLTPPSPQASNNVVLALSSFDNVIPLFQTVKQQLGEILSAFEFFDRQSYDLAVKHGQGRALNEDEVQDAQCFVLVETSGGKREHDEEVCQNNIHAILPDLDPPRNLPHS